MAREFDVIIFGATGYTGQYVIEELAVSLKSTNLKWAVAGRNIEKVKESLKIVQDYLGDEIDIRNTTIIKADVGDAASISDMCKRARLILNCVGPYKFYGETVVAACIENGTHHVDISGEMEYLETMQANYFKSAREKGVYVVGACGFDSIPADCGISMLKKNFSGDLNSVEYFVEIKAGSSGMGMNIGTFISAIHSFKDHILRLKEFNNELKKEVFKKDLVKSNYSLSKRLPPLFYSGEVKGWCFWFMGPDERVLYRSQKFRYEYLNDRPIQSHGYVKMPSFFIALYSLFFASIFGFLSLFSFGRNLLAKYPSFFTAGIFSTEGPTRQQVLESSTKVVFYGKGWKNKLSEPTDQHTSKPDTQMKLTIMGPEPAYSLTSKCMVQAGLTVLLETDKLPLEGGVLTPGVAFENTGLKDRLEKRGVTFKFENIN
ncbi:saccharopine dehydrogenase-like oxidoreductase [Caerostris darwini]|uniref:Saccharopine dehydrogenase-like oxidoreductase n=1 Tax=Caerostris darwini TaxID=1538125 RepID=A0AAV4P2E5_9ARAC|nr:saccharopine dehydrogenase-like oxidoreductase [Caerostris darwini]